ncbi:hypothetical protein SEA_TRES_10 [Mycobacterium phage Tres]|uniref:Uncharacterized protein n=1 Tax=Mycobacterium phage Tres TaxID=1701803 RepID=A0A0M3UL00_9CAUD|nr:hypothetical protein SEA_TRES_10 [Mycobacterium phage Tres]QYC54254.1 hypothetical protein SEA_ALLEGRO_10 [Mycobacterium phage Allegro]
MTATEQPHTGTFTMDFRHGKSDPLPYTATAEQIRYATEQAARRDQFIAALHHANPAMADACPVCNPPVRAVENASELSWWMRPQLRFRRWRYQALTRFADWLEDRA